MAKTLKISDTSKEVSAGSRLDNYWKSEGFNSYLTFVRPNFKLPTRFELDVTAINPLQKTYGIKDIGFGNWVTNEDRHNYINFLLVSLYDLNKVVQFNQYLGFNQLSVTFGARGVGKALAHYEPHTKIINITRYVRGDEPKIVRLVSTGGMGAFSHEYGHFLDYFAGQYLDKTKDYFSLTGGISTNKSRIDKGSELRKITDDILEMIIWKVPNEELSAYYKRLEKYLAKTDDIGDYYIRRNEMFARFFESWISYELSLLSIENKLLAKAKYSPLIYPTPTEIAQIAPHFRQFTKKFKELLFVK
ncbi:MULTISPECIES: LPD1 domain-containing protein [unclassified Arcicella]|uniref:LPD1 domain-containing protein n=1 Tax=unclassified Arcicella TaxID=2644986 RepID=UPI00285478A8|nr:MULTISPECIES: LPD1 domain-containing protein [unclassified Arcicella]MDR6564941.1 hypothetical protein [Arcicella sp. BE51]MDR6814731.1 hypothetical protein [Arcicella sp. BE140]MDR6826177.1 hypothetical protein [Arcicella sp. BE139]